MCNGCLCVLGQNSQGARPKFFIAKIKASRAAIHSHFSCSTVGVHCTKLKKDVNKNQVHL